MSKINFKGYLLRCREHQKSCFPLLKGGFFFFAYYKNNTPFYILKMSFSVTNGINNYEVIVEF